jgi:hypothetical protein
MKTQAANKDKQKNPTEDSILTNLLIVVGSFFISQLVLIFFWRTFALLFIYAVLPDIIKTNSGFGLLILPFMAVIDIVGDIWLWIKYYRWLKVRIPPRRLQVQIGY